MAYAISKSPTTIRAIRSADPTLLMMRHPFESCGQLLPALISSPHGGTLMWVKSGPEKDVETEGEIKSRGRSSCHAIPRFNDSPKNRLPWGDFGIRHGA